MAITEGKLTARAARTGRIWTLVMSARNWWTWRVRGYRQTQPVMVSFDGEPGWPVMIATIRPGSRFDRALPPLPEVDEDEETHEPYVVEDWVEASIN